MPTTGSTRAPAVRHSAAETLATPDETELGKLRRSAAEEFAALCEKKPHDKSLWRVSQLLQRQYADSADPPTSHARAPVFTPEILHADRLRGGRAPYMDLFKTQNTLRLEFSMALRSKINDWSVALDRAWCTGDAITDAASWSYYTAGLPEGTTNMLEPSSSPLHPIVREILAIAKDEITFGSGKILLQLERRAKKCLVSPLRRASVFNVNQSLTVVTPPDQHSLLLASPQWPLREGVAEPPDDPFIEIRGLGRPACEFGWSAETERRVMLVLKRIISGDEGRLILGHRYFILKQPVLFAIFEDRLSINRSRHIWGRVGNRSLVASAQQVHQGEGGDMQDFAERGNEIYTTTDDPRLAIHLIVNAIHLGKPAPKPAPASITCGYTCPRTAEVLHECRRCEEARRCTTMTKVDRGLLCSLCRNDLAPLVAVSGTPFGRSVDRACQPASANDTAEAVRDALKPDVESFVYELFVELDGESVRAGEGGAHWKVAADKSDQAVREAKLVLVAPAQNVALHRFIPARGYLVDFGGPISDVKLPVTLIQPPRHVAKYRDYYSYNRRGILIDSFLVPRPLRPSIERLRLVDKDLRSGHRVGNVVVTCVGYNYLKSAWDCAMPIIYSLVRLCAVLQRRLRSQNRPELVKALSQAQEKLARVIDELSANLARLPWSNDARAFGDKNLYAEVIHQAPAIVSQLGINIPDYVPDVRIWPLPSNSSPLTLATTPAAEAPFPSLSLDSTPSTLVSTTTSAAVVSGSSLGKEFHVSRSMYDAFQKILESRKLADTLDQIDDLWNLTGPPDSVGPEENREEDDDEIMDDGNPGITLDANTRAELLEVMTTNVDDVAGVGHEIMFAVKTALEDPTSRFCGMWPFSEEAARQILNAGDWIFVEGGTLTQQVQLKLQKMLTLTLKCDRRGWYIEICMTSFIIANVFFRIMTEGRCHVFDLPLRSADTSRNPRKVSEGHIRHKRNMFHGVKPPGWSLKEGGVGNLNFQRVNTIPESLAANYYRMDWTETEMNSWDRYVLRQGYGWADAFFGSDEVLHEWWTQEEGKSGCDTLLNDYNISHDLKYLFD
ncbi:hypothetical protein B0H16DRAFT_1589808 [Mycena metata]|uniref:Uncharacterized protein n=1 Tax=Mycena metata TaxID=1033252 RepID=A0AAD7HV30_9AGAR|nr:hypothetical protein B0H16DRAFT_1589808 [Mycena metata]